MSTAVATWGNSEAVRIPRDTLRKAGLRKGDRVSFAVNAHGRIEIVPERKEHRRAVPARGVSFETLFAGWEGAGSGGNAGSGAGGWPNDELVGAERDAWAS